MGSLTLIIPARNEAQRLPPTLDAYATELAAALPDRVLIHVVVNNTTDDTANLVREAITRHRIISLSEHPDLGGKGGAVRAGVRSATTDWVAFVDADGSVMPEDFLRLVRATPLLNPDTQAAQGAIASRRLPDAKVIPGRGLVRGFAAGLFSRLVRWTTRLPFNDTQCGAKLFRRADLLAIEPHLHENGWCFDVEWLLLLHRRGLRILEIPVNWYDRPGSNLSLFRDGRRMLLDLLAIRNRHRNVKAAEQTK